ncbi:DUF167 domain-containing protein [Rhodobacteraceae bacterium]|nr:DUF167 domain-containing protein [Paracoccaceae bacterium]
MADLTAYSKSGTQIEIRVTPKASRNEITQTDTGLRAYVTTVPEDGKANKAVQKLLARELGVAKSRLTLIRGQTSRQKIFQLD